MWRTLPEDLVDHIQQWLTLVECARLRLCATWVRGTLDRHTQHVHPTLGPRMGVQPGVERVVASRRLDKRWLWVRCTPRRRCTCGRYC